MKQSLVHLSAIQKRAKILQKEKSLKWLQALDEAAISFGFANFKNYQNLAKANRQQQMQSKFEMIELLSNTREEVVSKRLEIINSKIQTFSFSMQKLLDELNQTSLSKKTKRALCEKSGLNEFIKLQLLKDFLEDDLEMYSHEPYHVIKEITLKNLRYKIVGDALSIMGDFDLNLEFAFDYDPNSKDDVFNDREMIGDFELAIEKNNIIEIEDILIGYSW